MRCRPTSETVGESRSQTREYPLTAADSLPVVEAGRDRIDITGVVKRFGAVEVLREVTLDIDPHETVALLGPSGCGKTTLLRSIAGLERLDDGTISFDGDTVSGPGVHVRPEHRRIGMVFQDWALFPHLTVGENVEYGLSREDRRGRRVDETLESVGLDGLRDRMPATLSGGQQQRVALARALAPRPRAILLDEPFSNLDSALRVQVRTEVHRLLADVGVTTIFVTHDQEEAFVLGDRVAVMHDGRIEQYARPDEIYVRPATRWIADFVGEANLVPAHAFGQVARSTIGSMQLVDAHSGAVEVLLRPEQVVLNQLDDHSDNTGVDAEDARCGTGTVELVEYYGHDHVSLVRLDDGFSLRSRSPGAPRFVRGQRVSVSSSSTTLPAFDVLT